MKKSVKGLVLRGDYGLWINALSHISGGTDPWELFRSTGEKR